MIILLTVIAIVITGVPLTAVALVTVASRREETARSIIAGRAPGPLEGAARRLLAFHATGIGHPSGRVGPRHQGRDPGHTAQDVRVTVGRTAPADDPVPANPVPATLG